MHIVGQFRDLDDPDRFVWLRGFTDLPARAEALQNFYYGPVWRARSAEANPTMVDSDNALLLKPIELGPAYPALDAPRPPVGATEVPDSVIAGAIYHRAKQGAGATDRYAGSVDRHTERDVGAIGTTVPPDDGFVEFFAEQVVPVLTDTGAVLSATFETLVAENNFPALPLRDETVLAWFATFPDDAAYEAHRSRLEASPTWQNKVLPELTCRSAARPQNLHLRPTARSQFR